MQRRAVLFPEPLCPMMATTWPRSMSNDTPLSTWFSPKLLCTFCKLTTTDIQLPFHGSAPPGQGEAQQKIKPAHQREYQERLKERVVENLARTGEFHESDH